LLLTVLGSGVVGAGVYLLSRRVPKLVYRITSSKARDYAIVGECVFVLLNLDLDMSPFFLERK
jgi:hypothetical protein